MHVSKCASIDKWVCKVGVFHIAARLALGLCAVQVHGVVGGHCNVIVDACLLACGSRDPVVTIVCACVENCNLSACVLQLTDEVSLTE